MFMRLGKPNMFLGIVAGNIYSMCYSTSSAANCAITTPTLPEIDSVFALPNWLILYPSYGKETLPYDDMARFTVNIMPVASAVVPSFDNRIPRAHHLEPLERFLISEIEQIYDKVPGFTGVVFGLGGPVANM